MAKRTLFEPYKLGDITLKNRVVMCPLTRSRSPNLYPSESTKIYYRQRASAGLIITEATPVSEEARGYVFTPGIYNDEQVSKWKEVTDAVHQEGGHIFSQLWHVGRQSHTSLQPNGGAPVSSAAVQGKGIKVFGLDENGVPKEYPASTPRALETEEVPRVTADFVRGAVNAMKAGFDGIEVHGANGYIFEQFLNPNLNNRTDRYGGSVENRIRFLLETLDGISKEIGSHRTSVRLSPYGRYGDMPAYDSEEETLFKLASELSDRKLAYVHLFDQGGVDRPFMPAGFLEKFRAKYNGTVILAGGHDAKSGQDTLDKNLADLIAYGRPYISNPDLVERMKNGWPIEPNNPATYYTGGDKGYIDYLPYEG